MKRLELKSFPEYRHLLDNNENLVMDINTGNVTIVEDVVLKMLYMYNTQTGLFDNEDAFLSDYSDKEIQESKELIISYINNGIFANRKAIFNIPTVQFPNHFMLNVSHNCQLACAYCFADGGEYKRPDITSTMTWDVAKKAIDYLYLHKDKLSKSPSITFFGGEPLMNWEVIKKSVEYGYEIFSSSGENNDANKLSFDITTNGIGLNEDRLKFLNKYNVGIMFSIDGSKEQHNRLRSCKDTTKDSWQLTAEAVKLYSEVYGKKPVARATLTSLNKNIEELVDSLIEIGVANVHPQLVQINKGHELEITHEILDDILSQIKKYINRDKKTKNYLYHLGYFNKILKGVPKPFSCGFGCDGIAIEPDGNAYACHRVAGNEDFYVGNIIDGGLSSEKISKIRSEIEVSKSTSCLNCWLRYMCPSKCYAENYYANGDITIPNSIRCQFVKKITKIMIEYYLKSQKNTSTN